jgi:hypothetical protein
MKMYRKPVRSATVVQRPERLIDYHLRVAAEAARAAMVASTEPEVVSSSGGDARPERLIDRYLRAAREAAA